MLRSNSLESSGDDAFLLVRHRGDHASQAGRGGADASAIADVDAFGVRVELEPPARGRLLRVADVPCERVRRVVPEM